MRSLELRLYLAGNVEEYQKEFENLWRHLPEEAEELCCLKHSQGTRVEIALPWIGCPQEALIQLRSALAAFDQAEISEHAGMTAAMRCNLSPLWAWKDKHLRGGTGWKSRKSDYVPLTERWKPRGAGAA